MEGEEQCDDGNNLSDDGCTGLCKLEPGWNCLLSGRPCIPICGDGVIKGFEACDDKNTVCFFFLPTGLLWISGFFFPFGNIFSLHV